MGDQVTVLGVGMVPFATPSRAEPYDVMGEGAAARPWPTPASTTARSSRRTSAMCTATRPPARRRSTGSGMTGIPIVNVNNNCSTGSTALFLARQAVECGAADCVLAFGFEQMQPRRADRAVAPTGPSPFERFDDVVDRRCWAPTPTRRSPPQYFGGAGARVRRAVRHRARRPSRRSRSRRAGTPRTTRTRCSATRSPSRRCWPRRHVYGPLTRLQCCPPTCGAAAAVAASASASRARTASTGGVRIKAQAMTTDTAVVVRAADLMQARRLRHVASAAAEQVYEAAGVAPEDVPVVELHDCFTTNELLTYEALGLTPEGTAEKFIARRRQHLRRPGRHQPVRRPAVQGASARARPAWPSAPSWCGSCAGRPAPVRSRARGSALQHNIGLGGAVRRDPLRSRLNF